MSQAGKHSVLFTLLAARACTKATSFPWLEMILWMLGGHLHSNRNTHALQLVTASACGTHALQLQQAPAELTLYSYSKRLRNSSCTVTASACGTHVLQAARILGLYGTWNSRTC